MKPRPAWHALLLCAALVFAHDAAAAAPKESANYALAVQFENGEGVPRDLSRAMDLYCDAADDGDARAYLELGWIYANGRGVPRDDAVAVGWWRKAAEAGVGQAANLLTMASDVAPAADLGCAPPLPPFVSPDQASPALRAMVQRFATKSGLNDRLVLAVIAVESAFDPRAVSPKNALGLMQLLPETAQRFGVRNPFDPEQNVRGGTTYLSWLLQHFAGNLKFALAAYNAGEKMVDFYRGVPPFPETIEYLKRIDRFYPIDPAKRRAMAASLQTSDDMQAELHAW
jgi:soluble lytic murein transglycosylase-like protein